MVFVLVAWAPRGRTPRGVRPQFCKPGAAARVVEWIIPGRAGPPRAGLIQVKTAAAEPGHWSGMDYFPTAENGPQFEMAAVGRTLIDLSPGDTEVPRVGRTEALVFTGLALLAALAFGGWLLIS
jgi:hypothetical protein